jgi:hypothetical protein
MEAGSPSGSLKSKHHPPPPRKRQAEAVQQPITREEAGAGREGVCLITQMAALLTSQLGFMRKFGPSRPKDGGNRISEIFRVIKLDAV